MFEAQNGATSYVRFGRTLTKTQLQLEYRNISETDAYTFIETYQDVVVSDHTLVISQPNKLVSDIKDQQHMGDTVRGAYDGLSWKFAKPQLFKLFYLVATM